MENVAKKKVEPIALGMAGIKKHRSFIGVAVFLILLISISLIMHGESIRLTMGDITPLNGEWTLMYSDKSSEAITLPYITEVPRNEILSIERVLPSAFRAPLSIRLRSSMQQITVTLDGTTIFDNRPPPKKGLFYAPQMSAWHIIHLPEGSDGGLLKIRIASDVKMMSGRVNAVYYGHKGDLIGELITRQPLAIVFAFFLLVLGFLTGVISVVVHLDKIKRLKYLSLFASSMGIWLVSELDIMQLITGNNYLVGGISYVILPLALMGFLLLIREIALDKYSKVINGVVIFCGFYLLISMLLQLTMNLHFIVEFYFFNPVIVMSIIMVVVLLVYESVRYDNKVTKKYIVILSILLVTLLIEVVKFFVGDLMDISNASSIGIGLFLMILITDTLRYVRESVRKEGEALYLEKLAYTDVLTGGPNRSAFEKDVDVLLTAEDQVPFRLITFDLNNLKLINDQYGHNCGDQALKDFYQLLKEAYESTSKCYRVGGDEFMVIQRTGAEEAFIKAQGVLKKSMNDIELERHYMFRSAYGAGVYDYKRSFGDFKHEVDMSMYQMKKLEKKAY